ncbi:parB-like partition protein, partial [sediment metagenome]
MELGLPVQAMVVDMSDQQLFEAMERENRARKNLSAWEQGTMYRRALDEGLYPSQRRLAESLGVDVSLVSKSLSLARLPEAVVGAFASPLEIQFRWAQPLAEALQKDPDGVLARAAKLRAAGVA